MCDNKNRFKHIKFESVRFRKRLLYYIKKMMLYHNVHFFKLDIIYPMFFMHEERGEWVRRQASAILSLIPDLEFAWISYTKVRSHKRVLFQVLIGVTPGLSQDHTRILLDQWLNDGRYAFFKEKVANEKMAELTSRAFLLELPTIEDVGDVIKDESDSRDYAVETAKDTKLRRRGEADILYTEIESLKRFYVRYPRVGKLATKVYENMEQSEDGESVTFEPEEHQQFHYFRFGKSGHCMLLNYKTAGMIGGPKLVEISGFSPTNNYRTLGLARRHENFPEVRYWAIKVTFVMLDWCIGLDRALRLERDWLDGFLASLTQRGYVCSHYFVGTPHETLKNFYRRLCRVNRFADELWFEEKERVIEGAEVLKQELRRDTMLNIALLRKKLILRVLPQLDLSIARRFIFFDDLIYDLKLVCALSRRTFDSLYSNDHFVYLPAKGPYAFKTPSVGLNGFREETAWSIDEVKELCVDLGHLAVSSCFDFRILCHRADLEAALYILWALQYLEGGFEQKIHGGFDFDSLLARLFFYPDDQMAYRPWGAGRKFENLLRKNASDFCIFDGTKVDELYSGELTTITEPMKLDITIRALRQRYSVWEGANRLVELHREMPYLFVFARALHKTGFRREIPSMEEELGGSGIIK